MGPPGGVRGTGAVRRGAVGNAAASGAHRAADRPVRSGGASWPAAIPWLRRRDPVLSVLLGFALVLVALPIAGLPWQWFVHDRIAVSARDIGNGLSALPDVVVPYSGSEHPVRLVIVTLGAGVLLLDAAAVMALRPVGVRRSAPSRRRAAARRARGRALHAGSSPAALRPGPGPVRTAGRVRVGRSGPSRRRLGGGGALGGDRASAPRLRRPGSICTSRGSTTGPGRGHSARAHVDSFNWNQTYGPLHWPRSGHQVLTVHAAQADYWKAEDLDLFNGYALGAGFAVDRAAGRRPEPEASWPAWTQRISVTIQGMRTDDVIAAGVAAPAGDRRRGVTRGPIPATWPATARARPGRRATRSAPTPRIPRPPSWPAMRAAPYPAPGAGPLPDRSASRRRALDRGQLPARSASRPFTRAAGRTVTPVPSSPTAPGWSSPRRYGGCLRARPAAGGPRRHPVRVREQRRALPLAGLSLQRESTAGAAIRWRASCSRTRSATASSSPARWRCCCGWAGSRRGSRPASPRASSTPSRTAGRSPTSTPTRGSRCGSRATAGSGSTPRPPSPRPAAACCACRSRSGCPAPPRAVPAVRCARPTPLRSRSRRAGTPRTVPPDSLPEIAAVVLAVLAVLGLGRIAPSPASGRRAAAGRARAGPGPVRATAGRRRHAGLAGVPLS